MYYRISAHISYLNMFKIALFHHDVSVVLDLFYSKIFYQAFFFLIIYGVAKILITSSVR